MYITCSPVSMDWADIQFWFGFLLFFSGLSLHRMGPAFKRSNFGKPTLLMASVLILLPSDTLSLTEENLLIVLKINLPWLILFTSGTYLVLYGSQIYWNNISSIKILGLTLLTVSWAYYFIFLDLYTFTDYLIILFNILGMIIGLIFIIWVIKLVESRTPKVAESLPLSEKEKKFIVSILQRNLEDS